MRHHLFSLIFAVLAIAVHAQDPVLIMTTNKSINSQFSFGISANAANTPIQIDWGNGVRENFTIGVTTEFFGYPLLGSSVKIWGNGIASLTASSKELTELDVARATSLTYLYIKTNQITTLDLSNCTVLTFVDCSENLLTSLTLPNTPTLTAINCDNNLLASLNVSGATGITELTCTNNKLTFSTLPIKQSTWSTYTYSPQQNISLPKQTYSTNEEIDLSSQLTAGGNTTTYVWKTISGATLVKDVDYTESNGKFTFIKQPGDYFYCEMRNATFPELTLATENISITQTEPSITMITTTTIGSTFSFNIGATSDNTPIQVDWGNGALASYKIETSEMPVSGTLAGNTIKIYGVGINNLNLYAKNLTSLDVSNNNVLTKLNCYSNQLTALDVSNNTRLTYFSCGSNQLTAIDVTKNTALTYLYCNNNQLTALDVNNNTALIYLECSNNQLTALDVIKNTVLTRLWCYSNQLNTLDVTKNTALAHLNCSNNQLTALDVTNNTALTNLDCSGNQLTALDVTNNTALIGFDCSGNQLTASDVTHNTALNFLDCSYNQITALDLTNNTELYSLYCSYNQLTTLDLTNNLTIIDCTYNQLTTLDVTNNTKLTTLSCYSNRLTSLDVTKNTALTKLYCDLNHLAFSTLPIKQTTWTIYNYYPQNAIALPKKQYGLTETVNLSSELTIDGNTTNYTWKTKGGATLVAGTDYNVTGGVTTFLKVQTDSVYCQMTNATFPNLTLTTTNIKVSQFPLSVSEDEIAVKVYPNPATESFNLEMAEEIVRVEVYTLTGVKIFENELYSSTKVTVPLNNIPKGTLLVKVFTRNGAYKSKVVKI